MVYSVDAIRVEDKGTMGTYEYKYVDCYTEQMTKNWLEVLVNERYKLLNFRKKCITFVSRRDKTDIFILRCPKSNFKSSWLDGYYEIPKIQTIGFNATEENINEYLKD